MLVAGKPAGAPPGEYGYKFLNKYIMLKAEVPRLSFLFFCILFT
jgi:hypothetical protein